MRIFKNLVFVLLLILVGVILITGIKKRLDQISLKQRPYNVSAGTGSLRRTTLDAQVSI
jgi:hypothetical protein